MRVARQGERGVTAVLVAIMLAVLLGFVALTVDIGHQKAVRTQLQAAADSAALAGAKELDGTLDTILNKRPEDRAQYFASLHVTDGSKTVDIEWTDVELGTWDHAKDPWEAFTPMTATTVEEARAVNAVRVRTFREKERGNEVPVWFHAFLGRKTMDVAAEAVAVNGGECIEDCPDVPLTFFGCGLYYHDELKCWDYHGMTFKAEMSPDQSDTIGFSSLSPTVSANTDAYLEILGHTNCSAYQTKVNDPVNVSNGNNLTPLCGTEPEAPPGFNQYCQADDNGNCTLNPRPRIRAPVVDDPDCDLEAGILPKFNQAHAVIGYATFEMTKLACKGKDKYMEFQFICEETVMSSGPIGCGFWGTGPLQPKLVR